MDSYKQLIESYTSVLELLIELKIKAIGNNSIELKESIEKLNKIKYELQLSLMVS
jgi:hypothetical protein